jgi:flagellar hook protein FlgE
MFNSIYVGLSGLNAYSRGLQQVSNNVTNLNSSGFKGATVSFTDLFSVGGDGGLSYSGGGAGRGNGVHLGEASLDFRQGELRQSERDLDLAMDGSGFLVLMRGDQLLYTRTGSFQVDKEGYIVLAGTDYRLATLDPSGKAVSLSIDASRTSAPKQTTTVRLADNLSSTSTSFSLSDVKVYDAAGREHLWQVQFTKPAGAPADEWSVAVTDAQGKAIGTQSLKFLQGAVDPATSKLVFENSDAGLSVTLDLSQGVTSFSSGQVSTMRVASVDGHKVGAITAIHVNDQGKLEIGYSNEQKKELGPVAIADFRDPQALQQRSGGLFSDLKGLGQRELLTTQDGRVGKVVSRRLEASNVDLAKQFGDLILIQRGFQASSQIISVSNDMIQQLFGIRGQG